MTKEAKGVGEVKYREIELSRGMVTLVDAADYEMLSQYKWNVAAGKNQKYYARATVIGADGNRVHIRMHRLLTGAQKGQHVDHINGNPLDNRRENIRACSQLENAKNRKPNSNRKHSPYKGVTRTATPRPNPWVAVIYHNKERYHCGVYDTPEKAAEAYDAKAIELHGDFALTNKSLGLL